MVEEIRYPQAQRDEHPVASSHRQLRPVPQILRGGPSSLSSEPAAPQPGRTGSVEDVQELPQSVRLSHSGMLAELTADDLTDSGVVLSIGEPQIGMAEQSHVEVDDPTSCCMTTCAACAQC